MSDKRKAVNVLGLLIRKVWNVTLTAAAAPNMSVLSTTPPPPGSEMHSSCADRWKQISSEVGRLFYTRLAGLPACLLHPVGSSAAGAPTSGQPGRTRWRAI